MKKGILAIILTLLFVIAVSGAYLFATATLLPSIAESPQSNSESQEIITNIPEPDKISSITITSVGDIMVHIPQYQSAYNKETDSYDFSENFQGVTSLIQRADIAIANLETVFAGKDRTISGYPVFNTPDEMGYTLKEAGFDLLSTANNHSLDKGVAGVLRTLKFIKEIGLTPIGTNPSAEEKEKVVVKEIEGVKLAFLAYTYGVNGMPIPQDKKFLVNIIDENEIKAKISKAKELSPDLIIVNVHWGQEYQRQPNSFQKTLARKLVAAGADIILGSHPHVIQPFEKLQVEVEGGKTREGYVIYSLGNFISNQNLQTLNMKYVDSGVLLNFTIEKNLTRNMLKITNIDYIPTWVHKYYKDGKYHYKVINVEQSIAEYEKNDKQELTQKDYLRLKEVLQETRKQFTSLN